MKDFPEKSIDKAREIVGKYRLRSRSKRKLAKMLYDGKFLHINYGFDEAIRTGNCGMYLHEIIKEAECYTMAGVLYVIAREAGLDPKIYLASGMDDVAEGATTDDRTGCSHTFITCQTLKGKRHIVDPFMGQFGEVTHIPERHTMEILDVSNVTKKVYNRSYAMMKELSVEEYLERLEEGRGPGGGRTALLPGQMIKIGGRRIYVSYHEKEDMLKTSLHFSHNLKGLEGESGHKIIDLTTKVQDDGDFDFNDGTLAFYDVRAVGWAEHEGKQPSLTFSVKNAFRLWDIWEKILQHRGRKGIHRYFDPLQLHQILVEDGFGEDFGVKSGSPANRIVRGRLKDLRAIVHEVDQSANVFVDESKEEESFRSILRRAHYMKTSRGAKSSENPHGLLSSEEEREALLEKEFKSYVEGINVYLARVVENERVRVGLERGSQNRADRAISRAGERQGAKSKALASLSSFKKASFKKAYDIIVDEYLHGRKFDDGKKPIAVLRQGITRKDLLLASKRRLFQSLGLIWINSYALFVSQYQKGLKKILNASVV